VAWPRHLPNHGREQLFACAQAQGWALMRGGRVGPFTTANWLVRLKRADNYYGGYTPLPHRRTGVPCYCDGAPQGAL
jgi:hypothetical protein